MRPSLLGTFLLCWCQPLSAHAGEPLEPHDLWAAWSFEPGVVIPLLLTGLLYWRGVRKTAGAKPFQRGCFCAGWIALVLALLSPLHRLGEALFSAHMIQHEVLMLIAAPLLVLSRPLVPLLWALPFEWRRGLGRWAKYQPIASLWAGMTLPAAAWCLHAAALWVWHIPVLFEATLTSDWVHSAQHISFLGSAVLFWWSLFYARNPDQYGAGVLYLFTTAVHTSILGALLAFGRVPWYTVYAGPASRWHVSALEDQQIGGLIMWIPGGLVYLAAALVLFGIWLRGRAGAAPLVRYYAD